MVSSVNIARVSHVSVMPSQPYGAWSALPAKVHARVKNNDGSSTFGE